MDAFTISTTLSGTESLTVVTSASLSCSTITNESKMASAISNASGRMSMLGPGRGWAYGDAARMVRLSHAILSPSVGELHHASRSQYTAWRLYAMPAH